MRRGVTPIATKRSEGETVIIAELSDKSYELTGNSEALLLILQACLVYRLRGVLFQLLPPQGGL